MKLGLSNIIASKVSGSSWQPTDEGTVVAWYKKDTGITHSSGAVSEWADSANSYDMVQDDATERPTYANNTITFDGSNDSLQSASQISLTGAFTIGIKINPSSFGDTFLGDNTTNNELFKYATSSQIRVKIDGTQANMNKDTGTFGDDYLVIIRDSSNNFFLWVNGVEQAPAGSIAGTCDIVVGLTMFLIG